MAVSYPKTVPSIGMGKATAVGVGASPIVSEVPAAGVKDDDDDDDDPQRNTRETGAYVKQVQNQGAADNPIEIDMEESDDDNKEVRFRRKGEAMDCDVLTPLVLTDPVV
jgi:hypothetical protein